VELRFEPRDLLSASPSEMSRVEVAQ